MSICDYLEKLKDMQKNFLIFIENQDNFEENYQNLLLKFDEKKIKDDQHDFKIFLYLLVKVANNHKRDSTFFERIEKILINFKDEMQKYFSNSELFNIFKSNKRILLFLIHEKIIFVDDRFVKIITEEKYKIKKYPQFFSKEIKTIIEHKIANNKSNSYIQYDKKDDEEMLNEISELPENFEEERQKGENDEYICKCIQKDWIEAFITHINKTKCSLNSTINQSIFETNSFLLHQFSLSNEISLIEYAAFFGSVQIFKYLYANNVELTSSLWIYAIHGNKTEIINILEENHIEPEDKTYKDLLIESIKCHHNDIANYIKNKYLQNNQKNPLDISNQCLKYFNFEFIQNDDINKFSFCSLCQYDYYTLAFLSLKDLKIDVNLKKIRNFF